MSAVSVTISGIDDAKRLFGPAVFNQAMNSTLNKLAAQAKTAVSKEIRKTYVVSARDLSNAIKVNRSRPGALESEIRATGPRISLTHFDAQQTVLGANDAVLRKRFSKKVLSVGKVRSRPTRLGVTVRVRKTQGRKLVLGPNRFGAFIAAGRNGNFQVFMRTGKPRLPVEKLTGPAVAQMLGRKASVVEKFIADEAARIFQHELDFFASKVRGRG